MFEKEIKFIVDFNLNKIKKLGSFFTFEKLERAGVHPSILKYISSEIDFLVYEDRKKLLQNSSFDYSGSEILNYFNLISEEIKKTKRLNFEDVKKLLTQAVSFTANYLIRPKWSLSKLIFESSPNETTKSAEEIRYFLRFTYYYEYINTIFGAVINKKQITSLTKEEFEEIFEKFDKELFITQPQKMIDNALYSMADFFNIGAVAKTKITVAHIESFLRGKNLNDYIYRLKQSLPHDVKSKYEIDSIRSALYFQSYNQQVQGTEETIGKETNIEIDEEIQAVENEELNINLPENEEEINNESEPPLPIKEIVALQSVIAEIENEKSDFIRERTEEQNEVKVEELNEKEENKVEITYSESISEENQEEVKDAESLLTELERELLDDIDEALFSSETNFSLSGREKFVKPLAEEEKLFDEINTLKQQTDEALAEIENDSENENKNLEDLILEEEIPEVELLTAADLFDEFQHEKENEIQVEPEQTKIEYETDLDEQNDDEIKIETIELTVEDIFNEKTEKLIENKVDSEPDNNQEEIEEVENDTDDLLDDENEVFVDDENDEELIEEINIEQETVEKKVNIKREKDIFDFISDKEAAKITSVVFQDDSEDFATTLEKISECATYEEATEILKAVYNSYKVNYYSREAILLTNIVGNYFGQEL